MTASFQTSNRWLTALFRPRQIQEIIERDPYQSTNLIALFSCTAFAVVIAGLLLPEQRIGPVMQDMILPLAIGFVFGIPILNAVAMLLDTAVTRLGGQISQEGARSVIAWATLPSALFNIPWFGVQIADHILHLGELPFFRLIFITLWLVVSVWSLLILHPVLSGISKLSRGRTLLAVAAVHGALLVVVGATFAILTLGLQTVHLFNVEIPPQGEAAVLTGMAVLMVVIGLQRQNQSEFSQAEALMATWRPGELPDMEALELAKPWQERIVKPLWQRIRGYGTQITPADQIREMQKQLIRAGRPHNMGVTDFLGLRLITSAVMGVGMFMLAGFLPLAPGINRILLTIVGFSLGIYLPTNWLKGQIGKRQKEIQRALPDALDMLTICVGAGLGFDAALQRVAGNWENALAQEFRYVLHEMRVGVRRVEALRHLADRTNIPDLASLVALLAQADRLGVPLSNVLKSQSQQMRMRRRQRAEEEAHKAPVKMLLPLSMFVLPATMAVVLGPAIPRFVEMMSKF